MGITSTLNFIHNTTISRKKVTMKHFIAFSCLLAVAFGAPQYHSSHHNNPYSHKSYNTHHSSGGYQTHSSYHQQKPHKECETHYKTIYKTVIEHEKVKKCANTSWKRFVIKRRNTKLAMAKEPTVTILNMIINQFAIMKQKKYLTKNHTKSLKQFVPTKNIIHMDPVPMDMVNNFEKSLSNDAASNKLFLSSKITSLNNQEG